MSRDIASEFFNSVSRHRPTGQDFNKITVDVPPWFHDQFIFGKRKFEYSGHRIKVRMTRRADSRVFVLHGVGGERIEFHIAPPTTWVMEESLALQKGK